MFNLFRKIPKGYVETVDGYLIKESMAQKVETYSHSWSPCHLEKTEWYRFGTAPRYDRVKKCGEFGYPSFKTDNVSVIEDGTPIGYHTPEEVQKLKDRIKELEDKNITNNYGAGAMLCGVGATDYAIADSGCTLKNSVTKNKRGRPKKK